MDRAFPDTAAGADLTNKAKERGIFRLDATQAVRKGIFTDAEGAAMEIPAGSRFSGGSVNYVAGERLADGAYRLTCETAGEIATPIPECCSPLTTSTVWGAPHWPTCSSAARMRRMMTRCGPGT